jgi:hypothetical protein
MSVVMETDMKLKLFWACCHDFVVEEEDAFLIEASAEEAAEKILPHLSPQEQVKYKQMKEVYMAKSTNGRANAGCYYFLVSREAKEVKFESVALLSSDLSSRGGAARALPDIQISSLDELDAIDPAAY